MLECERRHREGAWAKGIYECRRANSVLPHERSKTRKQGRQLLWGRVRTREERVLENATRRRLDRDRHPIDGRSWRIRLDIEQRQRAQGTYIAQR